MTSQKLPGQTLFGTALLGLTLLAGVLGACSLGSEATSRSTGVSASATAPNSQCTGKLSDPDTMEYRDGGGAASVSDRNLVSLDVYRNAAAANCPAIIWVHGGGWRTGDKHGNAIETKVAFAGEMGAVLVSVNYRLVTPEIRWPVMGQDVASAVAWVIGHADDLGIDPSRVVLMGHSAGAHLVSIVATHPDLLVDAGVSREDVSCVIALDAGAFVVDATQVRQSAVAASAFGDDPADWSDASPTVQAADHPDGIPDFLVITRGSKTRIAEAQKFADTVVAAGSQATVVDAGRYSHEQVNTQLGVPDEKVVTPPTEQFLRTCFE